MLPLGGELAAALQDGQEAFGEGIAAALGNGTDDPIQRDRQDTQGKAAELGQVRHLVLQHGKIGIGIGLDGRLVYAKPFTAGTAVEIHQITSFRFLIHDSC